MDINKQAEGTFVCVDTRHIHTLKELAIALDEMDEDVFYYHVTPDKNDFAGWVSSSLGMHELAETIGPIKDKKELTYQVLRQVIRNC